MKSVVGKIMLESTAQAAKPRQRCLCSASAGKKNHKVQTKHTCPWASFIARSSVYKHGEKEMSMPYVLT
jgi:hypothetical protein